MPPIDPPKAQHQLSGSETAFFAYQMAHLCFPDACRSFPGGLHCTWPFPFLETAVGLGQKTLQNGKIALSELQTLPDCPFLTTVASAVIRRSFWTLDGQKWPKESEMALILVPSMGSICKMEGKGGVEVFRFGVAKWHSECGGGLWSSFSCCQIRLGAATTHAHACMHACACAISGSDTPRVRFVHTWAKLRHAPQQHPLAPWAVGGRDPWPKAASAS